MADMIDYRIVGEDMQLVEIELDPGEGVRAEAGAMLYMEQGIQMDTGMGQGDLLGQLSQVLPQMVDRATPEGRIPEGGLGDIGAILERFGGGSR